MLIIKRFFIPFTNLHICYSNNTSSSNGDVGIKLLLMKKYRVYESHLSHAYQEIIQII